MPVEGDPLSLLPIPAGRHRKQRGVNMLGKLLHRVGRARHLDQAGPRYQLRQPPRQLLQTRMAAPAPKKRTSNSHLIRLPIRNAALELRGACIRPSPPSGACLLL